jgi:UDP-GlcNAc:undecaprenyl-phosphate/decaprenyl-phosphate GlcNAc-1-phosphate transferase
MDAQLASWAPWSAPLVAAFLTALVASILLGGVMRWLSASIGAVVPPRPDRWHSQPTPTMGGVAIAGATIVAFVIGVLQLDAVDFGEPWGPVLLASLAMCCVGIFDDRLQLSPLAKLVASLAIGAFLVFLLAGLAPAGSMPFSDTLVATVWFAGLCHAINLLDNMDGLAAGVAFIAALFLVALMAAPLGPGLVLLLVVLAGALAGFLFWNRPPARLFMGDSGSLFIGALLGAASLVPVVRTQIAFVSPAVLVVLILIVPLFDTGFVLVLRRLAGRKASKGGTDHVSHRLASLGFSERSAVRILYLFGLIGGFAAWIIGTPRGVEPMALVAIFGVLLVLVGIYLARVPAYNAEDFVALQKSSFAPFLKDLTFRWHAGQVLLDLVLITVCYYGAYRLRFDGPELDTFLPYFTASLPVVLGCRLPALYASGLYQRSWETFGLRDLAAVVRGVGLGSLLVLAIASLLYRFEGFQRGVLVLDPILLTLAIMITRGSFRAMGLIASTRSKRNRRVLVYGAGSFGRLLVREMRANQHWHMNPVGFLDDDPAKAHRWIAGVPVRGAIEDLERVLRRYSVDEVVLSSPAINGNVEERIRLVCGQHERPVRRFHMEIE